ncbi:MAG: integrase, partial [bacterium]
MRSLTVEDIKEILRIEIRKSILHANHVHLGTNEFSQKEVIRSQEIQQTRQQNLKHTLEEDLKNYESKIDQTLDEILASKEIEANKSSVDYKKLKRNFIRIHDLRMKWIQELLSKNGRSDADFEKEAESVVGMHLYDEKQSSVEEPVFVPESKSQKKVQEKHESEKSFREIVEEYFNWKELEGTASGSLYEKRKVIEDFIEVSKVEMISDVTKDRIRNYIQIESKLPLHRSKNPRFRDKSVEEILLMEDVEGQGVKNINKKISILTTFGNWCEKNGYFEQNNFRGMKFDSKQKRLERENFTDQDLKKILNPQT